MELTIARLTQQDLPKCAELMMASNPWNRLYFTQQQCEEALAHPLMAIWGATTPTGDMAGFVATVEYGIGFEPMIEFLCVADGFRGQGVGTKLIAHFEEEQYPNADNLYLFVSDINPDAIRLYIRLGYLCVGALPNFNLEGQTEFLHRKSRRPVQETMRQAAGQ
jgi:ribosomal protein S18 acetylase RimI-like enzyme